MKEIKPIKDTILIDIKKEIEILKRTMKNCKYMNPKITDPTGDDK